MTTEIVGQVLTGAAAVTEKRRRCKFIAEWSTREEFSPWLACVNGDPHKAYCVLCEKLFPVSHGGLHDVKAHQKGKRHTVLEQEEFEKFLQYGVGHFQHLKNSSERKRVYNATTNEVEYWNVREYRGDNQPDQIDREVTLPRESAVKRHRKSSAPGDVSRVDINGNREEQQSPKQEHPFTDRIGEIYVADHHVVGKFRCAEERGMCSQPAAGKMEAPQQYCLRWKYHHSNLQAMFSQLLERECFCDVTLACEGKTLKAHKVMLSACSTYFDSIFSQYEESNPIVILKDVKFSDIKALVQFMYKGEINVDNSELTSLLKTAEELRIKGLAEVSWRSDREMEAAESGDEDLDQPQAKKLKSEPYSPKSGQNTISASLSSRDDYNESQDDMIEEDGDEGSENECSTGMWDTERSRSDMSHYDDDVKPAAGGIPHNAISTNRIQSTNYTNMQSQPANLINSKNTGASPQIVTSSSTTVLSAAAAAVAAGGGAIGGAVPDDDKCSVTSASAVPGNTPYSAEPASTASVDLSQYPDIMKMNDYLESGGRRPQFWEEPFTKRLMEAIKNKELEMKVAAELMGVSYGTLYGRYRDAYGCLKHPYRVRDFWSEQGPAEVLAKLQRKELTLFRAAEMLNVTVTTLANYLSTLRQGGGTGSSDNEDVSDSEDMVIDEDKVSTHSSSTTHSSIHNNPDITIVKKENLTNLNGN